jgi:signal transduction histidine kinase
MSEHSDSIVDREERLAKLEDQLARLQPLAALGELSATTTHEFNNVLMTILNYARLGLRHTDQATRDKALQKILDAGTRAAKITQTILASARNRSGDFEPTDLASLIRDSLVLLERELQKHRVGLELYLGDVPPARAEGNQIQQLVLNLVINARQAMPHGGTLTIRLEDEPATQSVVLTVRDTGSGIAPEVLPRIFEPQFTTKRGPDHTGRGGTGLGLSNCLAIVERHGGRIRVETALGQGTAFIIRLPAATGVSRHTNLLGAPTGFPSAAATSPSAGLR